MKQHQLNLRKIKHYFLKPLLFILPLIYFTHSQAQNVSYAWSKSMGGSSNDHGRNVYTDINGNVYTIGIFAGTADFDPSGGTYNLTSNGSFDIFISKLDANGDLVWARNFGSSSTDFGNSIYADDAGNVYATGQFQGTVDFDPGKGVTNLTTQGNYDVFILKLSVTGNLVWVKSLGSTASDDGQHILVDNSGNVYTAGSFSGTVDFDPGSGVSNLVSTSGTDAFISKLNSSGNFVWAKSFSGSGSTVSRAMKMDNSGNLYITGNLRGTADFDPGNGTSNLTSTNGDSDVFVAKLNASGNYVWAKSFGGTGGDIGYSIDVDDNGNVYTTGEFSETADFNPGSGTHNITAKGSADIFVSKLDVFGNLAWARTLGGTEYDAGYGIIVDHANNVYITGEFRGTADFDPGIGEQNLTSMGHTEIFITKLSPSGSYLSADRYGRNIEDKGMSIHMDEAGNIYLTGHFWVSVFFDNNSTTDYVSSKGGADIFVLKFNCAPTTGTHKVSACKSYVFNGITYTSDNNTAKDTLTNSVGCDSIVTLDLSIQTIDVTTSVSGATISANNTATGAQYQWINCDDDNKPISGATEASYSPITNGNYAVIISFKSCADTSDCININTVGIQDISQTIKNYTLYPNPTSGTLTISNFLPQIVELSIIDATGKVIDSFKPNKDLVNISHLTPGIYFITIQDHKGVFTQRIIKQ